MSLIQKKKPVKVAVNAPKGRKSDAKKDEDEEVVEVEEKNIDEHPFIIGHCLVVKYRDGSERLSRIIEKLKIETEEDPEKCWRYYIHYHDFNRRMDEWVTSGRIIRLPSEANLLDEKRKAEESLIAELTIQGIDIDIGLKKGQHSIRRKRLLDVHEDNQEGPTTIDELEHDEHEGMDEASLKEHEEITKVKNIQNVLLGKYYMECWYFSPLPSELFVNGPSECLYFCEFTFRYFLTKEELVRYQNKPNLPRHPPGNEIYRDSDVSMFEMDGAVEKVYCQNLCYFAKLFLDHKTLFYDVDAFLFYVLCTQDDRGFHPVGFFSKEKYSDLGFNLACILTFPSAQRKGFGRFLINFSYELSKKEEKIGAPEKPLSDLGAVSYKSYWASTLLVMLRNFPVSHVSIMDLARMTSILAEDITATLQSLGLLQVVNGNHILCAPPDVITALMQKYPVKGLQVDPEKLHWAPLYVMDYRKDKWSIKSKMGTVDGNEF